MPKNSFESGKPYEKEPEQILSDSTAILNCLCELAQKYGIGIGVEVIGSKRSSIRTVRQVNSLFKTVNYPNLGYVLDPYNLFTYSLTAASLALGTDVVRTEGCGVFMDNGIDGAASFTLIYGNNTMAHLSSSLIANEHNAWYVCGSKGIMEIRGVSRLLTIDIYNNKRELVKHYDAPKMISGYEYELLACKKALEEGRLECSEIPHAETLRIMKLLDELRSKIGITFPQ